jgi:predicted esterase
LLHGRDAYAETIFSIEHLLPAEFHIISIRATYQSPREGFEWFKPYDYGHPLDSFGEEHYQESLQLLTKMIQDLIEEKNIDKEKVFFFGFSQGAAMCYFLGLQGILKPKGVVPMSGFFPRPVMKWKELNNNAHFLITHGAEDKVLSKSESLLAQAFLQEHDIVCEYYEYKGRHKMSLPLLKYASEWMRKLTSSR